MRNQVYSAEKDPLESTNNNRGGGPLLQLNIQPPAVGMWLAQQFQIA